MKHINHRATNEDIGFQIAPMIDIVFVVLLFFMVKIGTRQIESQIPVQLPVAETPESIPGMSSLEETVEIDENGALSHNQEILDPSRDLTQLKDRMHRLALQSRADKTPVLVTICPQSDTSYSRIVNVLEAVQSSGITHLTLSVTPAL